MSKMQVNKVLIKAIKFISGASNYDRRVERQIRRSLALYKKSGWLNVYISYRIYNKLRLRYGINISPKAVVGDGLYVAHAENVLIGPTATIGDNCKIYPYFSVVSSLKHKAVGGRRHAIIGNDCICGAKATVVGPVVIGDDVTIAACAVVTKDVPSHSVVKCVNQVRPKRIDEIPAKYQS